MPKFDGDNYDEIDSYVDQLFSDAADRGPGTVISVSGVLSGEVLSGDWRIDRIDQIIQDTYDEAIWWHNQRISEGTDPISGLHGLKYVPHDEKIDGAMYGSSDGGSYERNNGHAVARTWRNSKDMRNALVNDLIAHGVTHIVIAKGKKPIPVQQLSVQSVEAILEQRYWSRHLTAGEIILIGIVGLILLGFMCTYDGGLFGFVLFFRLFPAPLQIRLKAKAKPHDV